MPALPTVVTMVTGFEWISSSRNRTKKNSSDDDNDKTNEDDEQDLLQVGTRFREVRRHQNRDVVMYKTITALERQNHRERYLSLGIGLKEADNLYQEIENTSTLFVQPIMEGGGDIDDDVGNCSSSLLIMTVAVGWTRWYHHLHDLLCRPCTQSMVRSLMAQELEDYRKEAMVRFQQLKDETTETLKSSS